MWGGIFISCTDIYCQSFPTYAHIYCFDTSAGSSFICQRKSIMFLSFIWSFCISTSFLSFYSVTFRANLKMRFYDTSFLSFYSVTFRANLKMHSIIWFALVQLRNSVTSDQLDHSSPPTTTTTTLHIFLIMYNYANAINIFIIIFSFSPIFNYMMLTDCYMEATQGHGLSRGFQCSLAVYWCLPSRNWGPVVRAIIWFRKLLY
jgi:hypothetical protein